MKRINLCYLAIAAALFASCGGGSGSDRDNAVAHNVFLVDPVPADGASVRDFAGQVEESRSVSAAFKTAGQIERIYVKEGDRVHRGQLLAELDSADYVLGISQLRVQSKQANDEFSRMSRLYATGGVSDNDFEKAKAGIEQLAYQVALNENKLSYCRLLAPTDGVVTSVNFERGEMVDAGTPVFDLMDNTHLEVIVDLPVSEYLRRSDFTSFTGSSPLMPGVKFPLQMLSLTPRADNNQLFQLKLSVSDPGIDLTPGMNLTVAIATSGNGDGAVCVPVSSVFDFEGHTAVFVYNPADSTVSVVPVSVNGTGADGCLTVTSGLSVSDRVVRAGVHHLVDGEKVRVIDPAAESNVGNLL